MKPAKAAPSGERLGIRVERWFHDHWFAVANYLGTIALAAAGVVGVFSPSAVAKVSDETDEATFLWPFTPLGTVSLGLLIAGAALVLCGLIGEIKHSKSVDKLSVDITSARRSLETHADSVESILRAILVDLCVQLGIYREDTRASLYAFNAGAFVLLARVSKNPVLKHGGRSTYPPDQGVIGIAWKEGSAALIRLPDDRADWEAKMTDYDIPADVVARLRMQCRSIVAVRVDGPAPEFHPLAIVVYESETKQGVSGTTIDQTRTTAAWATLTAAVGNTRDGIQEIASFKRRAKENIVV